MHHVSGELIKIVKDGGTRHVLTSSREMPKKKKVHTFIWSKGMLKEL